jgi:hypothetical protein
MAATWRATGGAIAYAATKDMLDVFNASGTARVIRAYRMYWFNNGTASVTGVITTGQVRRITAASSGTAVTPVKHDSNSSALDANTTCGTNRTVTGTDIFRRFLFVNEEPVVAGTTQANWLTLVPFAEIWNAGYGDTNVEPVTCRAAEGVQLFHSGSSTVGTADLEIEFTDAAS